VHQRAERARSPRRLYRLVLAAHGLGTVAALHALFHPKRPRQGSQIAATAQGGLIRRSFLAGPRLVTGVIASGLPYHQLAYASALTAWLSARGGASGAVGKIGLIGFGAAIPGFVRLGESQADSSELFDVALCRGLGLRPAATKLSETDRRRIAGVIPLRPASIERRSDIDYVGDGLREHRLDIYRRRSARREGAPILIYIHGGAWVMGSKANQSLPMLHYLAETGVIVVSVNYRLSPRATWPAQLLDCEAALGYVSSHAAEIGGDPRRIVVAGSSAGGHLASLLALKESSFLEPGSSRQAPSVAGCVGLYGVYDLVDEGGQLPGLAGLLAGKVMKVGRRDAGELYEEASPLYLLGRRDLAHSPVRVPFLLVHGMSDTLVPLSTCRAFASRLAQVSTAAVVAVELPDTEHAYDLFWSARALHTAIGVGRFIEAVCGTSGASPVS
jgi:acetyl esterase/lipase